MKVRDKGFAETNILVANENEVGVAQFRGWFAGLSLRPKEPNSMPVEQKFPCYVLDRFSSAVDRK
jgi:hypothetical protein